MENIKDILYDDVEQKFIELQDKKKKRRKRWRRIKLFTIIMGLFLGFLYFFSDYSKVKSLSVSGNTYYNDQEILSMAGLSYETRYIVMPNFLISWNLEKNDLIESVDVSKTINGAIHLNVLEKVIVGYIVEDGKNYLIGINEPYEKIEVKDSEVDRLSKYPLIIGFDDENLQKLVNAFNQKHREVGTDVISMISEINVFSRSYEAHMVKLNMQDGNVMYSFYDGIPLLNDYKKVLRGKSVTHACYEIDNENASIWQTKCE